MRDRPIPYDLTAERAVLGSILLDREAIIAIGDALQPADFSLDKHGWIYAAALACLSRRVPPDIATLADELRRHAQLDLVGGIAFLGELVAEVPTALHVEYYADIVAHAAVRRRLIETGGTISALGYAENEDLDTTLDRAEQTLFHVTQRQRGADFTPMRAVVQGFFDRAQSESEFPVVPTGLIDLDRRLNGGMRPGQLILLAARPGMGKSGLAMSIAYQLGVCQGRGVGVVSLEMSRDELLQRLLAIHTGVDTRDIAERVRRSDPAMICALGEIFEAPIAIEDSAMLSIMDVRSKARRLAAAGLLDLLIVDYLQLLVSETEARSRVDEVSRISRQLKLLARELGCPILALSQLSRAVEGRTSKVPQLSDLRDSGSLEQDADIVVFIYREELYDAGRDAQGVAELHIAKQRSGPLGIVPVQFDAPTTRFGNLLRR
jgi:replicative DNA helicase